MTTLKEFLRKYVAPNTLIRLWKPVDKEKMYASSMMITNGAIMNHEAIAIPEIGNMEFLYITDIVCDRDNEAINIVVNTEYSYNDISEFLRKYRIEKENYKLGVSDDAGIK